MIKIIFVITGLDMGGAERQVCDLADKLISNGYQVKIAYLVKPMRIRPRSNKVELVWLGGDKSITSMFKAFINLVKMIKKEKADVIHSHMFHANILLRLTRLFVYSELIVCTAHSNNEGGTFRMLLYRMTDFLCDHFTNVSQSAVKDFEKAAASPKGKMIAVYNGINTEHFQFNEISRVAIRHRYSLENKKVFIAIGRLHEVKDYPNLLDAFCEVVKENSNSHLLIVGDGELRGYLEEYILHKGLERYVTLLGVRTDIPDLLSAADVFVLSSYWEGFGLVVAEAMSCGRVVIATNSGGVSEVIGQEGILISPKNSGELALAMRKSIRLSEQQVNSIGSAARKRVLDKYSLDSAMSNWLKIYNKAQF
ncbi:glycosyltransferase [Pseudoalteromonas sp. SK20]|uniref:glycosyltransferase n=1 Tax=Pseudoalteromonas sp. SK20 TaxID=1938367 RepID=UPI0009FA6554|nr:glycosyltransferase [Pseudoalteromonas sp. SK20]